MPVVRGRLWYHGRVFVTGAGTLGDLVGDLVAYRSLRPCDERLADFPIPPLPPRKSDPGYAPVVGGLLQQARQLDVPTARLRHLLVIGDNAASDGVAFENLCARFGWSGSAVIVDERFELAETGQQEIRSADRRQILLPRWAELREWAHSVAASDIDEGTVVLLDIDKTLLGARGRNDVVIDHARGRAMRRVVAEALEPDFDVEVFEQARQIASAGELQRFTGDNQDYVAYITLVASAGILTAEELADLVRGGQIHDIGALVERVEAASGDQAAAARAVFDAIAGRIRAGDPTPFKRFRKLEYEETLACMGRAGEMSIDTRLREELVLTGEVIDVARHWKAQGALLFALSDKPDEAALPDEALRQAGNRPLHHVRTHVVDSSQRSPRSV